MTSNYNRSEILNFFELSEIQQSAILNEMDQSEAEETSFVIFNHKTGDQVLPLNMFMRIHYAGEIYKGLFDGVYATSAFDGYYIKFNSSHDEALIAHKYY